MSSLHRILRLLWSGCALGPIATAAPDAAEPRDSLDVQQVRAERERGPGGEWWFFEVQLIARAPGSSGSRFVSRPGLAVEFGFEVARSGGRRWEFYRAEAVAVAAEEGPVAFRFYLPPEVVARDRLSGEPRFYLIEPSVGGVARPTRRQHVSASLPNSDALAKFRARVAAEAPANRGVLRSHGAVDPRLIDGAGLPTLVQLP